MIAKRLLATAACLIAFAAMLPAQEKKPTAKNAKPEEVSFSKQVVPILTKYCTSCHGGEKPKGKMALDKVLDNPEPLKRREMWDKVVERVKNHEMPPEGKPKPTDAEVALLARWLNVEFAAADCFKNKDPGRVTLRRLNRAEYNNTIRDLLGVHFKPADDFPLDDVGYGFDNIGDVLAMPPMLFEKYLNAAEKIAEAAFQDPTIKKRIITSDINGKNKPENLLKILENFASRAFRRPARPEEVQRLMQIVKNVERGGDSTERGVQLAVQAVLTSPHFLFRVEIDPEPTNPSATHPVKDFELASRLSYFLWSSMPDEPLFELARQGTLQTEGHLEAQVRRMLKDPKAYALVENFAGQWLQIRSVKTMSPDSGTYPAFDEQLRAAMLKETELFFQAIMQEDRSVLEFLDSDFTFVNERLAKHYGIPNVKGEEFRRVSLKGTPRGGVLTQASVLTVTSNPTRTSPVKRGKYILENILGTPPPPPPPDVPELKEQKELTGSLRQRMEQHRADPNCATCHQRMDPLGFGFENFDGVGGWRTMEGKFTIDASGTLPDGKTFNGSAELRAILLKTKDEQFRRCLTEKLLTFALGRGLESYDRCAVDQISDKLAQNGHKFSALVIEIVKSEPFQNRRGEPKAPGSAGGKK